jgi:hypothetical protein
MQISSSYWNHRSKAKVKDTTDSHQLQEHSPTNPTLPLENDRKDVSVSRTPPPSRDGRQLTTHLSSLVALGPRLTPLAIPTARPQ